MLDKYELIARKKLLAILKKFVDTNNPKVELNYVLNDNETLIATDTRLLISITDSNKEEKNITRLFGENKILDVKNNVFYKDDEHFKYVDYERIFIKDNDENLKKVDSRSLYHALIYDIVKHFDTCIDIIKFMPKFNHLIAISDDRHALLKNCGNGKPIQLEFKIYIFEMSFDIKLIVMPLMLD